jgi:tetratricopeptide (TPR) repeat protein
LAFQVLKRCSEIVPKDSAVWHNLGKCCMDLRHNDNAERAWKEAVRLDPKRAVSWDGLGVVALRRGDFAKTIEYCDKALALEPNMMDSMVNRGMAYLAFRRWEEGWEGYRQNLGLNKDRKERIYGDEGRWDGTRGLNIACYGEQGIGDELTFASIIPELIRDSASVVVECDRRIEGLLKRSLPCEVYGTRYKEEKAWLNGTRFDARVAMGDLPKFYRKTTGSFPRVPYLKASPEMRLQWRALLDSLGRKPKIGLAWTGGINETGKERRSIKLEQLLPILKQDADFISLQYLDPTEELEQLEETHGIKVHHWSWAHAQDYDQTAALVAELDLVITVTTTVALTAGALGKECWVLVPERPIWMYCTEGEFPWFDLTLFRQNGKWPIEQIAAKLKEKYDRPAG